MSKKTRLFVNVHQRPLKVVYNHGRGVGRLAKSYLDENKPIEATRWIDGNWSHVFSLYPPKKREIAIRGFLEGLRGK